MTNKYTGEAPLQIGDRVYTLVYDWAALARIKSELAADALKVVLDGVDTDTLAKVVAIGMARHHPEMSAPAVMLLSPPLRPAQAAVAYALNAAYWGPEGPPPEVAEPNPPGRLARLLTSLKTRLSRP